MGVQFITRLLLVGALLTGSNLYAGEMINKHLPSNLKADLQVRYRMEYKDDFDLKDGLVDKDVYSLVRTRFSLDYTPVKQIELFGQIQDSRAEDMKYYAESTVVHFIDFRQLYASLNDIIDVQGGMPHSKFIFGRQSFNFGNGRLVGDPDWSNVGQTFDAGRINLSWSDPALKLDVFAGNLTASKSPREANEFFDRSTKDTLSGYYASWAVDKKLTAEHYLYNRKTNKNVSFGPSGAGELDEYTIGGRVFAKELHGFDYELEMAGQWGDFNDKNIAAFMGTAIVGHTFNASWKPRVFGEYNYASGDSDPTDGTRRTFDNLYPANHAYYGYMDLAGLQNLNNYRLGASVNPTDKIKLTVDNHFIYLDTAKDSWYSASRAASRTAAAGSSGLSSFVGSELDLWGSYKLCAYANLAVGYSHFTAGKFLEQTGANDDADFFYVQTTLNF